MAGCARHDTFTADGRYPDPGNARRTAGAAHARGGSSETTHVVAPRVTGKSITILLNHAQEDSACPDELRGTSVRGSRDSVRDRHHGTVIAGFVSRFRRSLEQQGFRADLSLALSKAFREMGDNVVQHSASRASPITGAWAYDVKDRTPGTGFGTVEHNLADMNRTLRYRTGDDASLANGYVVRSRWFRPPPAPVQTRLRRTL